MCSTNKINTCYISVGCNVTPHSLDWGINNVICYGACNSIAVYDPHFAGNAGSIRQTRAEHSGRVNCVRWIKRSGNNQETELISSSSDKLIIIWELKDNSLLHVCKLKGHEDIVTVVDAIYLKDELTTLIASASSDHSIKIWIRKSKIEGECCQTLKLKSNFALDLKLCYHPKSAVPCLIYGCDTKLHIMAMNNDQFVPVMELPGHEDWIRSIAIISENENDLLIASSAQDCLIKLWRLNSGNSDEETSSDINLKVKSYTIKSPDDGNDYSYSISLEANLAGHDNWIYGLHWDRSGTNGQSSRLLSASMDKTMIVWELDHDLGIWIEKVRVGEVGGNILGFYGCRFSPTGKQMIAHGFQGAFHLWEHNQDSDLWEPKPTVGGHFKEVVDFDWDPSGEYLVSVSSDQTTRLHCPWLSNKSPQVSWHEIARPQIHGYDISCISVINRYTFATGADEKLVRAFQAPKNFVDNFYRLTGKQIASENESLPEGASIPSLGLSNKAIYDKTSKCDTDAKHPKDIYQDAYFVSTSFSSPPTEETLLQNTLWPEVCKLYGHGNDIFALAANKSGTLLASACKAAQPEHARIIIWDTKTWKEVGRLAGHSLTITQMEFSPCGTQLLSIARDRTWCIFKLQLTDKGLESSKVAYSDKKTSGHARIIWSCSWCSNGKYFLTGARDKKAIIWGYNSESVNSSCLGGWSVHSSSELEEAVTAVAFAPAFQSSKRHHFALGLENGTIHVKSFTHSDAHWTSLLTLPNLYYHHLTVKRLRFRPTLTKEEDGSLQNLQLASCGEDHILQIYDIVCENI